MLDGQRHGNTIYKLNIIFSILMLCLMLSSCTMQEKTHYLDDVSQESILQSEANSKESSQQSDVYSQQEKSGNSDNSGDEMTSYSPINYKVVQGVWISYIEYGAVLTEKSKTEFTENISAMFDNLKSKEINTVVVQVRSHGDAYYKSSVYPWSRYVTGVTAQEADFDPLAIMIEQAHSRDISVHAWVNPYRLMKSENMKEVPDSYKIKQWYENAEYMTCKDDYWYLNPGNKEVRELIFSGTRELVENYKIDAIQIDDYFYVPSPASFEQNEQMARDSTTALVKGMYDTIKSVNSAVEFGVSPAGNYTDSPRSDATQFTDLKLWCTEDGYIDYVAPQIYWAFDDPVAPFADVMKKWNDLCAKSDKKLVIGLAAYKFPDSNILKEQVSASLKTQGVDGYIYFRYGNI